MAVLEYDLEVVAAARWRGGAVRRRQDRPRRRLGRREDDPRPPPGDRRVPGAPVDPWPAVLVPPSIAGERADQATCEAVLWDLAGQPDYRLVHSLFIDDADLALLVYDPTRGPDPLDGPRYWSRALRPADGDVVPTLLVASKADVGPGVLPDEDLAAFARQHRSSGHPS